MQAHASSHDVRRHPIRGALWGLVLGLGAALLLIGRKVIAFGTLPPILVVVAGVVLGVLWSQLAPVKGGDGPSGQAGAAPMVATQQEWVSGPDPMTGEWNLPVGSNAVPGGEYADPVVVDEPVVEAPSWGLPRGDEPGRPPPP